MKLAKFLRTLILKNILERLLPQFIDVLSSFIAISGNLMESICNAAPWIQEVNWTYIKLYVQFTSRVQRGLSEVKRQICVLYISVCLFCFLFFCVLVVFWTLSNIYKCCFLNFSKQPLLRYNLTEKINLPAFWCQNFDKCLLSNLHVTSKSYVRRNFRPREVWRPVEPLS